jgi:hypothetical protein
MEDEQDSHRADWLWHIISQETKMTIADKSQILHSPSVCCKLWRTGFLQTNNIYCPNGLKAQDVVFTWKAVVLASQIAVIQEPFYHYRQNPDSLIHKPGKHAFDILQVIRLVREFLDASGNYAAYKEVFHLRTLMHFHYEYGMCAEELRPLFVQQMAFHLTDADKDLYRKKQLPEYLMAWMWQHFDGMLSPSTGCAERNYFIKGGYQENPQPQYCDYTDRNNTEVWQPDVYKTALEIAERTHCKYIIDIGSGDGKKLKTFEEKFQIIAVDYGTNEVAIRKNVQLHSFINANLENTVPVIAKEIIKDAVAIFSDVVEHLIRPDAILHYLSQVASDCVALIISTPDRDRTHGTNHFGPPPNKCHVREWNLNEFRSLLQYFQFPKFTISYTRSNNVSPELNTILVTTEKISTTQIYTKEDVHPRVKEWYGWNEGKWKELKNSSNIRNGKVVFPYLAMLSGGACCLSCEHCSTHSPFRKGVTSLEEHVNTWELWSKILQPKVVNLGGGEPLLHPHVEQLVYEMKRIWKDSQIRITTNGVILPKISDNVLRRWGEQGVTIVISKHLDTPQYNAVLQKSRHRFNRFGIKSEEGNFLLWLALYKQDDSLHPLPHGGNPEVAFGKCCAKTCSSIYRNQFWRCANMMASYLAAKEGAISADKWLPVVGTHQPMTLDNTPEEILAYLTAGAMPECAMCPDEYELVPARQLS